MEKNKKNHKNIVSLTTEDYKKILLLLLQANNVGNSVDKKNCVRLIVMIDINQLHIQA